MRNKKKQKNKGMGSKRQRDPGRTCTEIQGGRTGKRQRDPGTTCKHFQEQGQRDPGRTGKKAPGAHYCYINKNKKIQIKDTNKKILKMFMRGAGHNGGYTPRHPIGGQRLPGYRAAGGFFTHRGNCGKGGNLQEHHNGSRIPEPIRNGEPIRAERSRRGSERGKGENLHGSG